MSPLDIARLDFEGHANAMERAMGRGGAPVNLALAATELIAVRAALAALASATLAQDSPDLSPSVGDPGRSAEHWFLDAAMLAKEGNREQARQAALTGIRALDAD